MVPDFALRIQAMIRSMREVILPALPRDQMLASDQANILVGYLRIMALQHDKVFDYLLTELSEYAELVRTSAEEARGGESTDAAVAAARSALARSAPLLQMSIPRQSELTAQVRSLKEAADGLLNAARQDGTSAFRQALAQRVMGQAERQIMRERVWFSASGFELDADQLPTIDEVLPARPETPPQGLD